MASVAPQPVQVAWASVISKGKISCKMPPAALPSSLFSIMLLLFFPSFAEKVVNSSVYHITDQRDYYSANEAAARAVLLKTLAPTMTTMDPRKTVVQRQQGEDKPSSLL